MMKHTKTICIFILVTIYSLTFGQSQKTANQSSIASINLQIDSLKTRTPQKGIKLAEETLNKYSEKKYPSELAKTTYLLGDTYYLIGEYTTALPILQEAAKKFEVLNDQITLPLVYIAIGRTLRKTQNDCKLSKEYFLKAEEMYQATNNQQELATVHNYIGNLIETCENDLEKALTYYYKTKDYYSKVKDTIGLSYSLDFISQINTKQEKYAEAMTNQTQSLALRIQIKDTFAMAISYTNIGDINKMQNNLNQASIHYHQALTLTQPKKFNDLTVYLLGNLAELYFEKKEFQLAYSYLHQQFELKDQLLNEEKHKQIAEMQTKYETEKKEFELQEEVLKNKNKTLLLYTLITTIVGLIIIISFIIQRRKIERQKFKINNLINLETERTRIARDLHDNLGAELALITSKIDIAMFKTNNEANKMELEVIRAMSNNANSSMRETIWSIYKSTLTIDELLHKTQEYVDRIYHNREGVLVSVTATDKDQQISPSNALHIYRIIQEAVNNASKYSDCTQIKIRIGKDLIRIEDNGKGFNLDEIKRGYGLQNLEQRAKELGAELTINSQLNQGTLIQLKLAS